ncbi:MAG: S8 family serine peptidase [Planctomycetales bacterium]|nr:S8 family serine peptidase [Planctomycetales bacterium]
MRGTTVAFSLTLCLVPLSSSFSDEDSNQVNRFFEEVNALIERIPDGADLVPFLREQLQVPAPNFRLILRSVGEIDLGPKKRPGRLQAATATIDRVQVVVRRDGDLAERVYIPTSGRPPTSVDLLRLDDKEGQQIAADQIPVGEVLEVRLYFSQGTMRVDDRELPLEVAGVHETSVRLTPRHPWKIDETKSKPVVLDFNVGRSIVQDPSEGFVLDPVLSDGRDGTTGSVEPRPRVGVPAIFPLAIREGTPTPVSAVVEVGDSAVDTSTLRLVRVFPHDRTVVLASLNDTGVAGDEDSDDGFFSAQAVLSEPSGPVYLRVEATSAGGELVSSVICRVDVEPLDVPLGPGPWSKSMLDAVEDPVFGGRILPNVLVLQIRPGTPFAAIEEMAAQVEGEVVGRVPQIDAWQIKFPGDGTAESVYAAGLIIAASDHRVETLSPEIVGEGTGVTTNDPQWTRGTAGDQQEFLLDHSFPTAWAFSRGGLRVGVVDSGTDPSHPDLDSGAGRLVLGSDWIRVYGVRTILLPGPILPPLPPGLKNAIDDAGHGTSVGGLVGALTDNATGIAGTTWFGHVFHSRVLGWSGPGVTTPEVNGPQLAWVSGIIEATDSSSHIINMSFGLSSSGQAFGTARLRTSLRGIANRVQAWFQPPRPPTSIQGAIQGLQCFLSNFINRVTGIVGAPTNSAVVYAQSRCRLTVASAGNAGGTFAVFPGDWSDLNVAASDPYVAGAVVDGGSAPLSVGRCGFSQFGPGVNIAARGCRPSPPRDDLRTTTLFVPSGGYRNFGRTSASAPITSGLASLYWSANRGLSPLSVKNAVIAGSVDGGSNVIHLTAPLHFRNADAAETFNPSWTPTGLWRNQVAPQTVTVAPFAQSVALRTWAVAGPPGLPDPQLNGNPGLSAWWFGGPLHGTYVGFQFDGGSTPGGGGTSVVPQAGVLATPTVAFLNSAAPVLQFKTWFEIESVDPVSYDIMEVVAVDMVTGATIVLKTLNPIAPQTGAMPALATPSGGTGVGPLGSQPAWVTHRVFLLSSLAPAPLFADPSMPGGHPFRIEFRFDTVDTKFNGFMGWIVDEVRIFDAGSARFPVLTPGTPTPVLPQAGGRVRGPPRP